MNKAVKLRWDGTLIRSQHCQKPSYAITLARRWSSQSGLAYAVTGLEMSVFRHGTSMNETSVVKLIKEAGITL